MNAKCDMPNGDTDCRPISHLSFSISAFLVQYPSPGPDSTDVSSVPSVMRNMPG